MKKEFLETFIHRYTLGGEVNKTKWKYIAKEKTLHTRGLANGRHFIVDVIMNDFTDLGPDDITICIGDTEKIIKMMSPFGEDVNFSINRLGDRILGFTLSDADCESYCTAADPTSIEPMAKNLNDIPDWSVVVPLTNEFVDKFLKASSALKDVKSFSVGMNKKDQFEIVIGYATANSNRIRIVPQTDPIKKEVSTAMSFPIMYMMEALKVNQDIPNGELSVHNSGLIRLHYKNDKYSCTYLQFVNKKA